MSWIRDSISQTSALVSSYALTALPVHKAGDLLVLICASSTSGNITISAGWSTANTFTNNVAANSTKAAIFTMVAATDDEALPTVSLSSSGYNVCHAISVGDAGIVEASNRVTSGSNVTFQDSPALTTLSNNALVIHAAIWNGTQRTRWDTSAPLQVSLGSASIGMSTAFTGLPTAGSVPTDTNRTNSTTLEGQAISISIANSVGGSLTPYVKTYFPRLVPEISFSPTGALNNSAFSHYNAYGLLTTLQGDAVENALISASGTTNTADTLGYLMTVNTSTTGVWGGGGIQLATAVDFTDKVFAFTYSHSGAYLSTRGVNVIFGDTSGNWAAFRCRNTMDPNSLYTYHISPEDMLASAVATSGTVDWTDIDRIVWLGRKNTVNSWTFYIGELLLVDPDNTIVICGGGANAIPSDPYWLKRLTRGWSTRNRFLANGLAQGILPLPIKFGDGTDPVYIDTTSASLEEPVRQAFNSGIFDYLVADHFNGIKVRATASSTVKVRQSIMASQYQSKFTIDSASSSSATYDFDGQQFKDTEVTLIDDLTVTGMQVIQSPETDLKNGTYTSCGWDRPIETYAAKIDAGAELINCTFVAAEAADYALRIPAAGSYDLSGCTFTGYTTDLHVTAASGTVTILLELGQTQPTYTSAGATVTFTQPTAVALVSSIVTGSRIQVYNVTAATEVANEIVAGTSWTLSYDEGTSFSDGDVVRIRLTYVNGTSAKIPEQYDAVATTAGFTVIASQTNCPVYNTNAIDGSLVTEFVEDYPNVQIDINDPDGVTSPQRMFAWWKYVEFTEDGIRDWFGGMTADDVVNYKVVTAILDLKLDNVSASPVRVISARLYRDDGATVIDALSNSIQMDPDKAYAVETGVSGLTAPESAQLMALGTPAANATAILDSEVETGVTLKQAQRAQLAVSTGKASGGGGTSIVFKDPSDATSRVTMSVDENGNRSSVTLNL